MAVWNYADFVSYRNNSDDIISLFDLCNSINTAEKNISIMQISGLKAYKKTFFSRVTKTDNIPSAISNCDKLGFSFSPVAPGFIAPEYNSMTSGMEEYISNTKIVVLYSAQKVSDIYQNGVTITDITDFYAYTVNSSGVISEKIALSDWITSHADQYFILGVKKIYDNSKDGSYSSASPRTLLKDNGTYCDGGQIPYEHFTFTKAATYDDSIKAEGLFELYYTPSVFWSRIYKKTGYDVVVGGPNPNDKGMGSAMAAITGGAHTYATTRSTMNVGDYIPSYFGGFAGLVSFPDLDSVIKHLNNIGIPWAFTESEALNKNTSDLPNYSPIGQKTNTTGGGDGNGDNSSDPIELSTPGVTASSYFNRLWACTGAKLKTLSNYLWSASFVDNLLKLNQSPSEAVVNLMLYPFNIVTHDTAHVYDPVPIQLGNVTAPDTDSYPIRSGYNEVFNMGSYTFNEYWGNAMDYSPYTQISLYLPYIGIKDIDVNEVMGQTVKVKYVVDISNGSCAAYIWAGTKLLYTLSGTIGIKIPLNSTNSAQYYNNFVLAAVTAGAGIGIGAVTGGLGLAAGAGAALSAAKSVSGNQLQIAKGGLSSANCGLYGPQSVYAIIKRPIQSLSDKFTAEHGYPCNASATLSSLSGYTEADAPVVSCSGTDAEKSEIQTLLKSGVII